MKKIYFYFHAGSHNHGCEAIVRSTAQLLPVRPILFSSCPDSERAYGIDKVVQLAELQKKPYAFTDKCLSALSSRFTKKEILAYLIKAKYESANFDSGSVAISIGGDNYCYGTAYNLNLEGLNRSLHRRKVKTVLWGCSIEPGMIDERVRKDLELYDLIVARESISYNALRSINPHTVYACDPAFTLKREDLPLPPNFKANETVGINVSPLIQKHEKVRGITLDNYRKLISHILKNTSYNIAFIPHVVESGNDDRTPLTLLNDEFSASGRTCLIEDCNCQRLKGFIARCKIFIGARTHATIAAYSSGVPTLVVGYSTKALGIAQDLFGETRHFVLPVQELMESDQLTRAFKYIDSRSQELRAILLEKMPKYCSTVKVVAQSILSL